MILLVVSAMVALLVVGVLLAVPDLSGPVVWTTIAVGAIALGLAVIAVVRK